MDEEIKILLDEDKVIISSQLLEKIKYLTRNKSYIFKKNDDNALNIGMFNKIILGIINETDITSLPIKNNEINGNIISRLLEEYNELLPKKRSDLKDINRLSEFIKIAYKMNIEKKNFYLMNELIRAKEDCLENMKYFLDDAAIFQFSDEYERAIQNKDIKKMSDMYNSIQQAILEEWKKYLNIMELDSMTDDNFMFIGHSTSNTKYDEKFHSRIVSTSLFNQDLTDTYRKEFGFIFAPKNIVVAKSRDMQVNNYAKNKEDLLNVDLSLFYKIDHPKKIIAECLKLKQQNEKEGIDKKVYSEIGIDGFEPVGIFCFTDGSKTLNPNYEKAKELQKWFPNLKIREFDIMKRKKGIKLDEMRLNLFETLYKKFYNRNVEFNQNILARFELFFEEYEQLKQNPKYTETDIETIFKNNVNLIKAFIHPDDLFKGDYDEKQIKYILGKNLNYNIDDILSGKGTPFMLNNLKKLFPYRERLNSMYAGLSEFLVLVSKIEVTDEMMEEINKNNSINFYTITKVLALKIQDSINSKEQTTADLENCQNYIQIQKEINERTKAKEQYEYYSIIYNNRHYAGIIKKDYQKLIDDLSVIELEESKLQTNLDRIIGELNKLDENINSLQISTFDENLEHIDREKEIEEIQSNISALSKYKIFNFIKIIKERNKIKKFKKIDELDNREFETHKAGEIEGLKSKKQTLESQQNSIKLDLDSVQTKKQQFYEELGNLKNKTKDYFQCESIEEIDLTISNAKEFINQYDEIENQYYLNILTGHLDKIAELIIKQENNSNSMQIVQTNYHKSM